jgi:hypothetical protein
LDQATDAGRGRGADAPRRHEVQFPQHGVESNAVDDDYLMTLGQIGHEQIWQRICEGTGDRVAGVGRERRDADRSGGE